MSLLRASATIGSLTLVSRVVGFVRDMLIAAALGASGLSDAFFVAFKIPNFMRRIFAEGAFNSAFVPLYAGTLAEAGRDAARAFAQEIYAVLFWVLILVSGLMILFMPWLMVVLAPGFDADPAKYDLTVTLTRITMPYILFISLVSLLGGILNSLGRFAAVAATPIIMNLTFIAAQLFLTKYSETPAHALAYGVFIAGITQYAWLIYFCRKLGEMPKLVLIPKAGGALKQLLKLMAPAVLGSSVAQINLMIDVIIASLIPNAVSYLYYADRLSELPLGVIGIAIATALLPLMSRQIREGKIEAARYSQNRALELALLFGLPSTFAFLVIAHPIISVVFERGAFGPAESLAVYPALMAFSAGLPSFLMIKILAPGFFANRDTKTPFIIATVCVLLNLALNLILMGPLKHVGLALSTSIAGWVNAIAMGVILHRRQLFVPDALLVFRLKRILAASTIMAVSLWFLYNGTQAYYFTVGLTRYLALGLLVSVGAAIFGISVFTMGIITREQWKSYFTRKPSGQ